MARSRLGGSFQVSRRLAGGSRGGSPWILISPHRAGAAPRLEGGRRARRSAGDHAPVHAQVPEREVLARHLQQPHAVPGLVAPVGHPDPQYGRVRQRSGDDDLASRRGRFVPSRTSPDPAPEASRWPDPRRRAWLRCREPVAGPSTGRAEGRDPRPPRWLRHPPAGRRCRPRSPRLRSPPPEAPAATTRSAGSRNRWRVGREPFGGGGQDRARPFAGGWPLPPAPTQAARGEGRAVRSRRPARMPRPRGSGRPRRACRRGHTLRSRCRDCPGRRAGPCRDLRPPTTPRPPTTGSGRLPRPARSRGARPGLASRGRPPRSSPPDP